MASRRSSVVGRCGRRQQLEKLAVEDNESVAKHSPNNPLCLGVRMHYIPNARDAGRVWRFPRAAFDSVPSLHYIDGIVCQKRHPGHH